MHQNVTENVEEWEILGKVPDDAYLKFARDGFLLPMSCGNRIPKQFADYPIAAGIKAHEWNGFHDFVLWDEIFRGAPSLSNFFVGLVSLPPFRLLA